MPKDPERQRRHAVMLTQTTAHVGWRSQAPFSDKLEGWLARWDADPNVPGGLVLIDADGTRRVLDEHLPVWMGPATFLAIGLGISLFFADGLVARVLIVGCFALVSAYFYANQTRLQRHLLLDARRRSVLVLRGRRVVGEIPFEDIDVVFVEVKADPGYSDQLRAVASVGSASLPLTRWTIDMIANTAADAVAKATRAPRDPAPRRLKPEP
jgi:hypothetical protein